MKIKKLEFTESYLYKKPTENYSRGISVYLKEEKLCWIEYDEDKYPVTKDEKDDNEFWLKTPRKTLTIVFNGLLPYSLNGKPISTNRRFLLDDKEFAKKEVYKIMKKYIKFFTK